MFTCTQAASTHSTGDAENPEDGRVSPILHAMGAVCTLYKDGDPCRRQSCMQLPISITASNGHCLPTGACGACKSLGPRLETRPVCRRTSVAPWLYRVRIKVRKGMLRMKQAQSGLVVKASPVPLEVFKGMYKYLCNL
eukprot:3233568-Pleurochrysis_carterae.AAC.2